MRFKVLVAMAASTLLVPVGVALSPGTALASGCNSNAVGSWSNNCTVVEGDVNNLVIGVQEFINASEGCGFVTTDGSFGSKTLTAVKCMQHQLLVTADGSVGPITWAAMQHALRKGTSSGGWRYWGTFPNAKDFRESESTSAWQTWDSDGSGRWVSM